MFRFGFLTRRRAEQITAPPAKVTTTNPANGTVNLQLDAVISWARSSMAQSYNVYFGEDPENFGDPKQSTSARTYVPGELLALDGTYYFRIDSINSEGTTTGDVVSFSTWSADDILTLDDGITPRTTDTGEYIEKVS